MIGILIMFLALGACIFAAVKFRQSKAAWALPLAGGAILIILGTGTLKLVSAFGGWESKNEMADELERLADRSRREQALELEAVGRIISQRAGAKPTLVILPPSISDVETAKAAIAKGAGGSISVWQPQTDSEDGSSEFTLSAMKQQIKEAGFVFSWAGLPEGYIAGSSSPMAVYRPRLRFAELRAFLNNGGIAVFDHPAYSSDAELPEQIDQFLNQRFLVVDKNNLAAVGRSHKGLFRD